MRRGDADTVLAHATAEVHIRNLTDNQADETNEIDGQTNARK